MSNVNILVHAVWGTKNNVPYLTGHVLETVTQHIVVNTGSKGICIAGINGYRNHLHCLISLGPQHSISQVAQLIKGESSYWANKTGIVKGKFEWADEYYAFSVSPSKAKGVLEYIRDQQEHHARMSWEEEVVEFLKAYEGKG
jgi:putative transposase